MRRDSIFSWLREADRSEKISKLSNNPTDQIKSEQVRQDTQSDFKAPNQGAMPLQETSSSATPVNQLVYTELTADTMTQTGQGTHHRRVISRKQGIEDLKRNSEEQEQSISPLRSPNKSSSSPAASRRPRPTTSYYPHPQYAEDVPTIPPFNFHPDDLFVNPRRAPPPPPPKDNHPSPYSYSSIPGQAPGPSSGSTGPPLPSTPSPSRQQRTRSLSLETHDLLSKEIFNLSQSELESQTPVSLMSPVSPISPITPSRIRKVSSGRSDFVDVDLGPERQHSQIANTATSSIRGGQIPIQGIRQGPGPFLIPRKPVPTTRIPSSALGGRHAGTKSLPPVPAPTPSPLLPMDNKQQQHIKFGTEPSEKKKCPNVSWHKKHKESMEKRAKELDKSPGVGSSSTDATGLRRSGGIRIRKW